MKYGIFLQMVPQNHTEVSLCHDENVCIANNVKADQSVPGSSLIRVYNCSQQGIFFLIFPPQKQMHRRVYGCRKFYLTGYPLQEDSYHMRKSQRFEPSYTAANNLQCFLERICQAFYMPIVSAKALTILILLKSMLHDPFQ